MKVTIKYGADTITKSFDAAPTIGDLRRSENLRAALGYGDNSNFLIGGVAQGDNIVVPDDATVSVETAANQKA